MKIRYLIALVLVLFLWTLFCEWYHGKCDKKDIKTDTVEVVVWDTMHDSVPDIRYEKVTKYVPVPDSILITDTITNEKVLPVVQRTYTDDSTYTAYVSGAKIDSFPRLDSIDIYRKTVERTVTRTVYIRKGGLSVKVRPSLSAGYDPLNRNWGVLVGGSVILDW